jgi:hypothetical protein
MYDPLSSCSDSGPLNFAKNGPSICAVSYRALLQHGHWIVVGTVLPQVLLLSWADTRLTLVSKCTSPGVADGVAFSVTPSGINRDSSGWDAPILARSDHSAGFATAKTYGLFRLAE